MKRDLTDCFDFIFLKAKISLTRNQILIANRLLSNRTLMVAQTVGKKLHVIKPT